jgi:RecB family exonuclease
MPTKDPAVVAGEEAFHASSVNQYLTCPRAYYYRHQLKIPETTANFSAFQGSAIHAAISAWHASDRSMSVDELVDLFLGDLKARVTWAIGEGRDVEKYDGEPSINEACAFAQTVLTGYTEDSRNHVELIANELSFYLQIGKYPFEGTVDQIRKLPDGTISLVDIKTGMTKPNSLLLNMDYQMSVYALAVKNGVFARKDDPEATVLKINKIPDSIAICHVRDYIPKKKNQFAETITTDEYEINPDTGRKRKKRIPNPKFDEGYKAGDVGPVFYYTTRSENDLRNAEKDIGRVCASIRFKMFFRRPVAQGACVGFCRYVQPCQQELADPEADDE